MDLIKKLPSALRYMLQTESQGERQREIVVENKLYKGAENGQEESCRNKRPDGVPCSKTHLSWTGDPGPDSTWIWRCFG